MTDLILKLEAEAITLSEERFPEAAKLLLDARDEIERLRAAAPPAGAARAEASGLFALQFLAAGTDPTEEGDYLLYNQCDGYHFATAYFDNGFDCFMTWNGGVFPKDGYCAWARLPESHNDLFNLFATPEPAQS